ncbi:MAG: AI-2E family transporter [Candidatus Firestonebacteria bacterium]
MPINKNTKMMNWAKLGAIYFVLFLLLFVFYMAQDMLTPFLIAFILVYLLAPLVDRIEGLGIKRGNVVVLIFVGGVLLIGIVIFLSRVFLMEEFSLLKTQIPTYLKSLESSLRNSAVILENHFSFIPKGYLNNLIDEKSAAIPAALAAKIPALAGMIMGIVTSVLVIFFTTFFLLKDGRKMRKNLIKIVPNKYFESFLLLLYEINQSVGAYVRGQIIDCSIVAVLSIAGLYGIGLKYAIVIGLLSGIFNVIPYLGPVLSMLPGILVAVVEHQSIFMALKVVGVLTAVQLIDNAFVSPIAVGKSVDIHPLAVIIAVMTGGALMGVWGMLIAVPAFCALRVTFQILYKGIIEYGNWESE